MSSIRFVRPTALKDGWYEGELVTPFGMEDWASRGAVRIIEKYGRGLTIGRVYRSVETVQYPKEYSSDVIDVVELKDVHAS